MHISLFALLFLLFVVEEASAAISEVAIKKINNLKADKKRNEGMEIKPIENFKIKEQLTTGVTGENDNEYYVVHFKNIHIKNLADFVIDDQKSTTAHQGSTGHQGGTGHLELKFHTLSISCDVKVTSRKGNDDEGSTKGSIEKTAKFKATGKNIFATADATGLNGNGIIKLINLKFHEGSQSTLQMLPDGHFITNTIIRISCGKDCFEDVEINKFNEKLYKSLLDIIGDDVQAVFNHNLKEIENHLHGSGSG